MSLKNILLLLLIMPFNLSAQTFVVAANDVQGDPTMPNSPDAMTLSYALTSDSILFKMDFYERIDNKEWNITFGLDTNQNVNDGAAWQGQNTSMNYDLLFKLSFSPGFPPISAYVIDASGMNAYFLYTAEITDTATVIAGIKLADYSISRPLQFIAGTGIVLGDINDDLPDNTYISIPTQVSSIEKSQLDISLYPNPTRYDLNIQLNEPGSDYNFDYDIMDIQGRIVGKGNISKPECKISLQNLNSGTYQINLYDGKRNSNLKFQKIN